MIKERRNNRFSCKMLLVVILIAVTGFATANGQSTERTTPENVLFMGNSYIYFWNLPQQVASLAQSGNVNLRTAQSTEGGSNWSEHWRGSDDIESVDLIESGDYDAVIIQNHSLSSIVRPDSLLFYGKKFAELIRNQNANVFLYMTWARKNDPSMIETIEEAYVDLAKETGAKVVPVGLAWERVRKQRPQLELYDPDGSHPSPLGSYLTACVFYRVLKGQPLQDLPERLTYTDKDGQKLYLNILPEDTARFLQEIAEKTVRDFQDK